MSKKSGIVYVMIIAVFLLSGCESSQRAPEKDANQQNISKSELRNPSLKLAEKKSRKRGSGRFFDKKDIRDFMRGSVRKKGLSPADPFVFDHAKERLLHYSVRLTYESGSLINSRAELLAIAAKYGFIKYSSTSIRGRSSYISTQLKIKSRYLYAALQGLDKVGKLVAENISVQDLTERMVWDTRRVKRLKLRETRNKRGVVYGAKNWLARERNLQRTEDNLDRKAHDKWKIKDRVAWADVTVYVRGPESEAGVEMPNFKAALIWLASAGLALVEALVYMLPFLVIVLLVIRKRKTIKGWFIK